MTAVADRPGSARRPRPLGLLSPSSARGFASVAIVGWLSSVVFFGGWLIISAVFGPVLFPGPVTVIATAGAMLADGTLLESIGVSLSRIGVGYAAGLTVGISMGLLLSQVRLLDRVLMPIISLGRMVPPTAIIPLAIIWFGIDEPSKYFIVFWGCVLVIFLSTYDGVARVPQTRVWAAQCFGADRLQVLRGVVLPSAVPSVWTGARAALGLAFMSVVAAELIAARSGIGFLIMQSRVLVQTDRMFVGLLALAVTGLVVDLLFTRIGGRLLRRYLDYHGKS